MILSMIPKMSYMTEPRFFLVTIADDSLDVDWIRDTLIYEQGKFPVNVEVKSINPKWLTNTL